MIKNKNYAEETLDSNYEKSISQSIINLEITKENESKGLSNVVINGLTMNKRKLFLKNNEDAQSKGKS